MRIDIIPYILIEVFIAWYYLNGMLIPKNSKLNSNLIISMGYVGLAVVSCFSIPSLNIISFFAINFGTILFAYDINIKSTLFHTTIMTVMMMIGELIIGLLMNFNITHATLISQTPEQLVIYGILSKFIYFLLILLLKNIFKQSDNKGNGRGFLCLLIVPISTFLLLSLFNQIINNITYMQRLILIYASVLLVVANLVVYWEFDRIIASYTKINILQEAVYKNKLDYESYKLIQMQYTQSRSLMHDLNKHLAVIESLLAENREAAQAYIKSIRKTTEKTIITDFSGNKILDIILSQKQKICSKHKIDFNLCIRSINIDFMSEIDIVSVFSNMLDNAIESCIQSRKKEISLTIYVMNDSYIVISLKNSADKSPIVKSGRLISGKTDSTNHGLGIFNIERTISKYNGDMQWEYNKEKRQFKSVVMMQMKNN